MLMALKTYCYDDDPLFVACGISIEKQLTQVDGCVLEVPKVGNGEDCIPRNGRWNFNKERWEVVNFSTRCDTSHLSRELINCGRNKGIIRADSDVVSTEWEVESDDESEEESEWYADDVGSRSHVHLSLWANGKNIFMASGGHSKHGMSKVGEEFMAGVLNHLPSILAFAAPLPNRVSQSSLRDLLLQCCMDDAPDIRQSAFALFGDLARVCPIHLHPRLSEFLDVASKQLVRQEISPIVMTVISFLIPILQHAEELNKSLIENSATTLGRVAWVCPGVVSPHMEHCLRSF
ncbi:unnamed protein product [Camellia sinensis]